MTYDLMMGSDHQSALILVVYERQRNSVDLFIPTRLARRLYDGIQETIGSVF
jgi:hypothetical protein